MAGKKPPCIHTARLTMRPLSDRDAEVITALFIDDEVTKTFMVPELKSRDEQMKLFELLKHRSASDAHFVYGVYLDERLIGFVNDVDLSGGEIELGYVIAPAQKSKGFATEVLAASIRELFAMGYGVVKAGAFEENGASMRVMEKCGMTRTKREEDIPYRGETHRCVNFEIRKASV